MQSLVSTRTKRMISMDHSTKKKGRRSNFTCWVIAEHNKQDLRNRGATDGVPERRVESFLPCSTDGVPERRVESFLFHHSSSSSSSQSLLWLVKTCRKPLHQVKVGRHGHGELGKSLR
jgi:hypothetical protein